MIPKTGKVSFKDGTRFLNVYQDTTLSADCTHYVPKDHGEWVLTSCIWDAQTESRIGGGGVIFRGTRAACIHNAKLLLTLDVI